MDARGVVVDAIVYGSQQSNSSANGTITSPEIAILEGDQSQGGCIVVVPGPGLVFGPVFLRQRKTRRSVGRIPTALTPTVIAAIFCYRTRFSCHLRSAAGSINIKVTSVADFSAGQKIIIGTGPTSETAVSCRCRHCRRHNSSSSTGTGTKVIPVASVEGLVPVRQSQLTVG